MAKTKISMKALKKPTTPKITDSQTVWDNYEKAKKKYDSDYSAQKKEKERRKKLVAKK